MKVAPGGVLTSTALANSCSAQGIAISQAGNVYVSCSAGVIQQYSAAGAFVSSIQSTDLSAPTALAFDAGGNLWVAANKSLIEYTSGGVEAAGSPYGLSASPLDVTIDPAAIWSTAGYSTLLRVDNGTHGVLTYPQSVAVLSLAADHSNNVWGASSYLDLNFSTYSTALELADSGALVSPATGYPGTYVTALPAGVAVDGVGSAFTTNNTANPSGYSAVVLGYSAAGPLLGNRIYATSPQTSLNPPSPLTTAPGKPVLDQSGNLWVPGPFGAGGYLTSVIGFGAPVVAPLATGVATGTVGVRP